jgi:hypothetical protein
MIGLAMPASRSLIALLIGTVVFFALWVIALKPSGSNSNGNKSQQGLGQFQSDINRAHHAVATSNANDAASGNENATASSGGATAAHTATTTSKSTGSSKAKTTTTGSSKAKTTAASASKAKTTRAAKPSSVPAHISVAAEMSTVRTAVTDHKVLALLFYNPAGPDDQALKQELTAVPSHRGQVVKLAIPLNDAASFTAVTQQVALNLSPTLVLISRTGEASEDVGYTAPFVIDQQVQDALAAAS